MPPRHDELDDEYRDEHEEDDYELVFFGLEDDELDEAGADPGSTTRGRGGESTRGARSGPPSTAPSRTGPGARPTRRPVEPKPPSAGGRAGWRITLVSMIGILLGAGVGALVLTLVRHDSSRLEASPTIVVPSDSLPQIGASSNAGSGDEAVGQPAPPLLGQTLDGDAITVSPGGAPQALVFLAHWCPNCQNEVREIVRLAERNGLAGVAVTGVVTATSEDRPNYPPSAWLERERWTFPTLADTQDNAAARAYGITGVPTIVLVDEAGRVAARLQGTYAEQQLRRALRDLAAGREVSAAEPGARSSVP